MIAAARAAAAREAGQATHEAASAAVSAALAVASALWAAAVLVRLVDLRPRRHNRLSQLLEMHHLRVAL